MFLKEVEVVGRTFRWSITFNDICDYLITSLYIARNTFYATTASEADVCGCASPTVPKWLLISSQTRLWYDCLILLAIQVAAARSKIVQRIFPKAFPNSTSLRPPCRLKRKPSIPLTSPITLSSPLKRYWRKTLRCSLVAISIQEIGWSTSD